MKKKWISFLLFGLMSFCCSAQKAGYKFYSQLDTVKRSGFYNIEITPELNTHVKTDYSDIRIINSSSKWVPHILRYPAGESTDTQLWMDLKFIKTENSKVSTTLEIENSRPLISNINLVIRNTAAERFCTLSGSDDRVNWFVLNDSIMLAPAPSQTRPENTLGIDFPPSSYKFFRLIIHNNNKDPFDIKGVVEAVSATGMLFAKYKLVKNPVPVIGQKDSNKISYVRVSQQLPYQFDNISLQLTGVKYFRRQVDLCIPDAPKHSFSNPGRILSSFTISNNSTLNYKMPLTKASVFYLIIHNEDNLPLTVKEVNTGLYNRYITTYLEKDSNYKLIMDNDDATLPNYDLAQLNEKLPDSTSYLQFGKITAFPEIISPVKQEKKNNWILWTAIAAALVILLFFTFKMLKEVDKRKTT